jgi:excisionase family DNA binding protein
MSDLVGYVTTREAAEALGIAHVTMRDAVRRGAIRAITVAHRTLIPTSEIERYRHQSLGRPGRKPRRQEND